MAPVKAKTVKSIIRYGELFGAKKLVPLQDAPHIMARSWGSDVIELVVNAIKKFGIITSLRLLHFVTDLCHIFYYRH